MEHAKQTTATDSQYGTMSIMCISCTLSLNLKQNVLSTAWCQFILALLSLTVTMSKELLNYLM